MTTIAKHNITESFLEITKPAESAGFKALREKAVTYLRNEGLPVNKEEEYKYTPISKKLENSLNQVHLAAPIDLSAAQVKAAGIPALEADLLVFNNGRLDEKLSSYSADNYSVKQFADLGEEEAALVGTVAKVEKDPFSALNSALFEEGTFIHIPKGKVVEKPIFLLHFVQANENGQVIVPRVFIHGEANSEATFIQKVENLDEKVYFLNSLTEVKVGENAHLHFYQIQNESKSAIEVNNFESDIYRDATFTAVTLSLQGDLIRNNLSLNLLDSGCEGNMYGLYLLNGQSHVDNHTNVDHTMPHADSNELYKGILADKSRGVFNGKIFVRQDAQKTNAFQQNNNILLSEDAIINTKPQLEIWADDVKCSHGCTTGQLDEEALFYLQARGIGKLQAKSLLLYAFAGEILDHIKIDALREYCIQLVQERLGKI